MVNKRKPNELWTNYLVRTLQSKGHKVPSFEDAEKVDFDRDENLFYFFVVNNLLTKRGKVHMNRMLDFGHNIFSGDKRDLEKMCLTDYSEWVRIIEADPQRGFEYSISRDGATEIQDHSSEWRWPPKGMDTTWKNMPFIEKYKNKQTARPKQLIDDTIRYIDEVGLLDISDVNKCALDITKRIKDKKNLIVSVNGIPNSGKTYLIKKIVEIAGENGILNEREGFQYRLMHDVTPYVESCFVDRHGVSPDVKILISKDLHSFEESAICMAAKEYDVFVENPWARDKKCEGGK